MRNRLLITGVTGTILVGLCCVTPLLPAVLTAIGLPGLIAALYNDAVLLPSLAGFVLITGFAIWQKRKTR